MLAVCVKYRKFAPNKKESFVPPRIYSMTFHTGKFCSDVDIYCIVYTKKKSWAHLTKKDFNKHFRIIEE
jgi:hypothetical protein